MSIAFHIRKVRINMIEGLSFSFLKLGSPWQTGNLLFKANMSGLSLMQQERQWAKAVDEDGREYVLWHCNARRRMVAQALDSFYCFEVYPIDPP